MDTLFHTADGSQRAECLGVQAPEIVLSADLEQGYHATFLPGERKCLVTSLSDLPLKND